MARMKRKMGDETCAGAGATLQRHIGRKAVVYPINVRGIVPREDMKVPYSELAVHVRAAGKPLVAFGCKTKRDCGIVWKEPDGTCGFTFGLPSEVMHAALRRQVGEITGFKLGSARKGRR